MRGSWFVFFLWIYFRRKCTYTHEKKNIYLSHLESNRAFWCGPVCSHLQCKRADAILLCPIVKNVFPIMPLYASGSKYTYKHQWRTGCIYMCVLKKTPLGMMVRKEHGCLFSNTWKELFYSIQFDSYSRRNEFFFSYFYCSTVCFRKYISWLFGLSNPCIHWLILIFIKKFRAKVLF